MPYTKNAFHQNRRSIYMHVLPALVLLSFMLFGCASAKRWGYADKSGKITIPAQYYDVGVFKEGISQVKQRDSHIDYDWLFIDRSGRPISREKYYKAGKYSEGLAPFCLRVDEWGVSKLKLGFVDTKGNVVIRPDFTAQIRVTYMKGRFADAYVEGEFNYERTGQFMEGLCAVGTLIKDKFRYMYIDRAGAKAMESVFYWATEFSEGLAAVMPDEKSGKWAYINKKGQRAVKDEYDSAWPFSEGLGCVKKGGKFGYIDKKGNTVLDFIYITAYPFKNGYAAVQVEKDKYNFIDKKGAYVLKEPADEVMIEMNDGLAPVRYGNKWGYADTAGNFAIPCKFEGSRVFSEGLAAVRENNLWGFIDRTGKYVIAPAFANTGDFSEGMVAVEMELK